MSRWIHRTTKRVLISVPLAELPEPEANYIKDPDLSAVEGQPQRYWIITGDVITLADAPTQAVIDAALLVARRDEMANDIDKAESFLRSFALIVLDEFNATALKINEILDAIDNADNLGSLKTAVGAITDKNTRTPAQLKTAVRNRMDT